MLAKTIRLPNDSLYGLLDLTMNHTDIALHIESLYPPRFSLLCGERANVEAWLKGYDMFCKSIAAIHQRAFELAKLDCVSKSKLAETQINESAS